MAIEVANIRLVNVNGVGNIVYKSDTISNVISNINQEHRVFEAEPGSAQNAAAEGATTAPTVTAYLKQEDSDGRSVVYMDQYTIITQS